VLDSFQLWSVHYFSMGSGLKLLNSSNYGKAIRGSTERARLIQHGIGAKELASHAHAGEVYPQWLVAYHIGDWGLRPIGLAFSVLCCLLFLARFHSNSIRLQQQMVNTPI
jgi:hypothetical protein